MAKNALPLVALGGLALWLLSRRDGAASLLGPGPAGEAGIGGGGGGGYYDPFAGYQSGFETGLQTGLGLVIPTGAGAGAAPPPSSKRFRYLPAVAESFQADPLFGTAIAAGGAGALLGGLGRLFRGGGGGRASGAGQAAAAAKPLASRAGSFGEAVGTAGKTGTRGVGRVGQAGGRALTVLTAGVSTGYGAASIYATARGDTAKGGRLAQTAQTWLVGGGVDPHTGQIKVPVISGLTIQPGKSAAVSQGGRTYTVEPPKTWRQAGRNLGRNVGHIGGGVKRLFGGG